MKLEHKRTPGMLLAIQMGVALVMAGEAHARNQGRPLSEPGLAGRQDILFFEDFEGGGSKLVNKGRRIVRDEKLVFAGQACLESQNEKGSHNPYNTCVRIRPGDTRYLRFYTRFEEGYDFGGGVKGPGLTALARGRATGGGAGIRPKGDDKFGGRVCFDRKGAPYIYYYHMDMGKWGSNGKQNKGRSVRLVPGKWYAIEMMLKANDPAERDGELKLWIDGTLKAHHTGIHWRTTEKLKINWANHSAYFGGSWVSPKDQKRYEDNYVVADNYIGPMQRARPKAVQRPRRGSPLFLIPLARPRVAADDPLAKHLGALEDAEKKARAGDLDAAAEAYRTIAAALPEGPARQAMTMREEGAGLREALVRIVVARFAEKGPQGVYVDFGGRAERARLTAATASAASFKLKGSQFPMAWQRIPPKRLGGIAAKYAASTTEQLTIAKFLLACGETDAARRQVENVLAASPAEADAKRARALGSALK